MGKRDIDYGNQPSFGAKTGKEEDFPANSKSLGLIS